MTTLLTEVNGHVHLLTLNRPQCLNALSAELVDALHQGLNSAESTGARVVVIAAQGQSFSAGFDLKQHQTPAEEDVQMSRMQDLTARLREIRVPSVCAVQGNAVGAGLELALACDVVIATPSARLSFPDVRAGFSVGGGVSYLLPRMIGLARARFILLTGGELSGSEALAAGMIAQTAGSDDLQDQTLTLAHQLAALDSDAVLRIRSAIEEGLRGTMTETLDRELDDMTVTKHAPAGASATQSFREHGTYSPT